MKRIHGHEVMQMMLASGKVYTRETLVADILKQFGPDARFHTCSAEDLTAEGLVDFLDAKGKLVSKGGGIQTSRDLMCRH